MYSMAASCIDWANKTAAITIEAHAAARDNKCFYCVGKYRCTNTYIGIYTSVNIYVYMCMYMCLYIKVCTFSAAETIGQLLFLQFMKK